MTIATSIRKKIRNLINSKLGGSLSLYDYDDATVTTDDYGDDTSISWGSAVSVNYVSSSHTSFKRALAMMGVENIKDERSILVADNASTLPAAKDKIVIGSEAYEVIEVSVFQQIQDTVLAYRVVLGTNEGYTA